MIATALLAALAWRAHAAPCAGSAPPLALAELDAAVRRASLAPAAGNACWDQVLPSVVVTDHFVVEHDDGVSPALAADAAQWLEEAIGVQVDSLGWRPPLGWPEHRVPVYLSGAVEGGAFTGTRACGDRELPFIGVTASTFSSPAWAYDTLAHEVNHTLQHAYSPRPREWLWEATATWIEAYASDAGSWSYWLDAWAAHPELALEASARSQPEVAAHMYGMALFLFYLDQHVGGPDVVRGLWEAAAADGGTGPLSLDDLLAAQGLDGAEVYDAFLAVAAARDLSPRERFPRPAAASVAEVPASGVGTPLEARGQGFVGISPALAAGQALRLRVVGDARVPWIGWLVPLDEEQAPVPLTFVDGVGEATLPAGAYDEVWAVVSPVPPGVIRGEGWPWSWTLEGVPRPVSLDPAPESCAGCGAPTAPAWAGIALGALLSRRRRRP